MKRFDETLFYIMILVAFWAFYTAVGMWTAPADPYVPSIEIPADNRTLLDDLIDRRCLELRDEIMYANPRMRRQTVEDITDAILTADSVDALNHRDLAILSSLESRWALEIGGNNRNDWRAL